MVGYYSFPPISTDRTTTTIYVQSYQKCRPANVAKIIDNGVVLLQFSRRLAWAEYCQNGLIPEISYLN